MRARRAVLDAQGASTRSRARRSASSSIATSAALLLLALLIGCDGQAPDEPAPPAAPTATPRPEPAGAVTAAAEAEEIFRTRCVTCHGTSGAGDGPGSSALTPQPRNFRDPAWQAEVDDEHIANIVMYGGAAVGRSPTMPGNPDLASRPDVVEALVAYVRSLPER